MEYDKCPICNSPLEVNFVCDLDKQILTFFCYRCGTYNIEKKALELYKNNTKKLSVKLNKQIAIFTGWIRENQNVTITEEIINKFYYIKLPTLEERATNLLKSFTDPYDLIGGRNVINFDNLEKVITIIENIEESENTKFLARDLQYMAATWSYDIKKLKFIYEDYLINEKKYLETIDKYFCKITPKGWVYLESLHQPNPDSKKAFVAMWFDPEMEKIYDGFISKSNEAAGFEPIQIGRKEHNDDINDAIIGEIRSSKFVVADFTGNRGGVYYEAGFAYGLNIPVIYTCKKDQLKNVHFDVNHRNIIDWKDGDDLYKRLLNRINSTIT